MVYPTYGSLVTKVNNDYDLTDENFISSTELLGLFNDAIRDIEKLIHDLHCEDKYFMTFGTITLVNGTQDYSLPTDIYGHKIRHFYYDNGSRKYEIKKLRKVQNYKYSSSGDSYEFLILNLTSGPVLRILPTPAESGAYGKMFYIRECRRFTSSTSDSTNTLELPEAENAVVQHVKRAVAFKTKRADLISTEDGRLKEQIGILESSLKEMIPDENNLAQMDLTSYYEQAMGDVLW